MLIDPGKTLFAEAHRHVGTDIAYCKGGRGGVFAQPFGEASKQCRIGELLTIDDF